MWLFNLHLFSVSVQFSSVSVVSNSLLPHGLQHARPPCPSPTPGARSNSCLSCLWCPPTISSSVVPFSSHPSIFPSIRVFSNDLVLCIRWPKYWSFTFSVSPSNEYSGLISFRMDCSILIHPHVLVVTLRYPQTKWQSEVAQSCPTHCDPVDYSTRDSSVHGIFPGKSTGMGSYFLLQGIFWTQGSNAGLPHRRQTLYHLNHQGSQVPAEPYSLWYLLWPTTKVKSGHEDTSLWPWLQHFPWSLDAVSPPFSRQPHLDTQGGSSGQPHKWPVSFSVLIFHPWCAEVS